MSGLTKAQLLERLGRLQEQWDVEADELTEENERTAGSVLRNCANRLKRVLAGTHNPDPSDPTRYDKMGV